MSLRLVGLRPKYSVASDFPGRRPVGGTPMRRVVSRVRQAVNGRRVRQAVNGRPVRQAVIGLSA